MDADQLKQQVNDLLKNGKYDDIKPLLLSYKDTTEHDNDLAMVCYLCTICEREKAAGEQVLFSKISDMDELLDRYTALKFYLRRNETYHNGLGLPTLISNQEIVLQMDPVEDFFFN